MPILDQRDNESSPGDSDYKGSICKGDRMDAASAQFQFGRIGELQFGNRISIEEQTERVQRELRKNAGKS